MKKLKLLYKIFSSTLFLFFFQTYVHSQSLIIKDVPQENISIDFRFIHPFYKSPSELNVLSGTYDLNISLPIGGKWNINTTIPFVVYKNKYEYSYYGYNYSYEYNKSAIGNIYLGLQTRDSTSSNIGRNFSFGVFLPTSSKGEAATANIFGFLTNYYDLQKYPQETITLYSNLAFRWYMEDGIRFGLDIGPQYLMNISNKGSGGNEFFLHYGLSGGVSIDNFVIKSEFTGILILTGEVENFTDRFINFFSFGLGYDNSVIKPAIFYQLNFHELYKNLSTGSLGLKLSYVLE
jgi:hypothetical protein